MKIIDWYFSLSLTAQIILAVIIVCLFALPALKEEMPQRPEKKIWTVVKSEKFDGVPEWKYIKHFSDRNSAMDEAISLQKENDKATSRKGRIRFIVVPLEVKESPFTVNGTALLRKEYERRTKLIIQKKCSMDVLF